MSLSPRANALLKAAKRHESGGPPTEARDRMRRRVLAASVASAAAGGALTGATTAVAGTAGSAAASTAAVGSAAVASGAAGLSAVGVKIAAVVLFVGLAGGGISLAMRGSAQNESSRGDTSSQQSPLAVVSATVPSAHVSPDNGLLDANAAASAMPTQQAPALSASVASSDSKASNRAASVEPPPPKQPTPPADDLKSETTLLARAQNALSGGQPSQALSLTEEHAQRFPNGALSLENRAIRALALCALGRKSEGLAEAARLPATTMDSPLGARVTQSCR